ncbi:hypothetical protein MBANPS3_001897 [Mucor bainieri]
MDRPQPPDAFSRTLDSKPRHSHIHQLKQHYAQDDNESTDGGSTPLPPSKPPSLSKPSVTTKASPRQPPPPPMQQPLHRPSQQQPKPEAEIDQTPLAFKDIRARFQQDNALPIRNQQASSFCRGLYLFPRY